MSLLRRLFPPQTKAARNEGRKLLATSVNAIGLAVFAVGGLTPLLTRPFADISPVQVGVTTVILILSHLIAQALTRRLED